jgi:hypothetical protein
MSTTFVSAVDGSNLNRSEGASSASAPMQQRARRVKPTSNSPAKGKLRWALVSELEPSMQALVFEREPS